SVDHVEPVEQSRGILLQVTIGDYLDFIEGWLVLKVGVNLVGNDAPLLEAGDASFAADFDSQLLDLLTEGSVVLQADAAYVAVEATTEPAIGGEHQQRGVPRLSSLLE